MVYQVGIEGNKFRHLQLQASMELEVGLLVVRRTYQAIVSDLVSQRYGAMGRRRKEIGRGGGVGD